MIVVSFQTFRVIEFCIKVLNDDGFSFRPTPQTISYWESSSFPDSSWAERSFSTSISLILDPGFHLVLVGDSLIFHRAVWSRGSFVFLHSFIICPILAHLRHLLVFLRHLNSCAERLRLGSRRVASNSIASPPCWVVKAGRYVPFGFLGVVVALWSVSRPFCRFLLNVNLVSFSIAHLARVSTLSYGSLSPPHTFCSVGDIPIKSHSPSVASSSSDSLDANLNSFQYSVIVRLPCVICLSRFLASPFLSMMPN